MPSAQAERFLDNLKHAYDSARVDYQLSDGLLSFPTKKNFGDVRKKSVAALVDAVGEHQDDSPRAYVSEWTTLWSLAKPLDNAGYTVEMASAALEQGDQNRKGVDIVIAKRGEVHPTPTLAINVKLRPLNRTKSTETQRFDDKLCAPMITLSLGDWKPENREKVPVNIRDWIDRRALPKMTTTGKIPQFYQMRKFVFTTVRDALENYLWKTEAYVGGFYNTEKLPEEDFEHDKYLFPKNPDDFLQFHQKLHEAHTTFDQLTDAI